MNNHKFDTSQYIDISKVPIRDYSKCEKCGGLGYVVDAGVGYYHENPCDCEYYKGEETMSDEWKERHKTSNNSGNIYPRAPQAQGVDIESLKQECYELVIKPDGQVYNELQNMCGIDVAIDYLAEQGLLSCLSKTPKSERQTTLSIENDKQMSAALDEVYDNLTKNDTDLKVSNSTPLETTKQTSNVCINSGEEVYKEALEALNAWVDCTALTPNATEIYREFGKHINTIRQALSMAIKEK